MDEALTRAGWRTMPDDATRRAWEAKEGRLQALGKYWDDVPYLELVEPGERFLECEVARPVHLDRGWDYCPEGWGDHDQYAKRATYWCKHCCKARRPWVRYDTATQKHTHQCLMFGGTDWTIIPKGGRFPEAGDER